MRSAGAPSRPRPSRVSPHPEHALPRRGAKPRVVTAAPVPAGVFCCGPAPVRAIKEGDLQLKYDIPFVFAEVNADVVYWVVRGDGTHKKSTHCSIVGKNISTKSVGRDSREDITHNYKYPEGTAGSGARGALWWGLLGNRAGKRFLNGAAAPGELQGSGHGSPDLPPRTPREPRVSCTTGSEKEREVFAKAEHETSSLREVDEGLHLKIKLAEGANNGHDFDVFAVISNNSDTERVCRLMLCARTASYNGTVGPQCGMKDLLNVTLAAQEGKSPGSTQG